MKKLVFNRGTNQGGPRSSFINPIIGPTYKQLITPSKSNLFFFLITGEDKRKRLNEMGACFIDSHYHDFLVLGPHNTDLVLILDSQLVNRRRKLKKKMKIKKSSLGKEAAERSILFYRLHFQDQTQKG